MGGGDWGNNDTQNGNVGSNSPRGGGDWGASNNFESTTGLNVKDERERDQVENTAGNWGSSA